MTDRLTDLRTDTAIISNNSLHLMHSTPQPLRPHLITDDGLEEKKEH